MIRSSLPGSRPALRRHSSVARSPAAGTPSISADASSSSPAARAGSGLVMARKLAAQGRAAVPARARRARAGPRAARLLRRGIRGEVLAVRCDVRRRADVRAARGSSSSIGGAHVDVLINNAGVIQVGPLEHMEHRGLRECDGDALLGTAPPDARADAGRCAAAASAASSTSRSIGGRIAVPHLAPYSRQQVRADRALGRGARRARAARHPRHHRVSRA